MSKLEEIVKNSTGETREALEELVHTVADLVKEQRRLKDVVEHARQENGLLRKHLFGCSSEKRKDDSSYQVDADLFNEFELCAQAMGPDALGEPAGEDTNKKTTKKRSGRKPLPKNLPRKIVEHDLSEEEKICICGKEMECIGCSVSEQLDYQPAKAVVIEHRCKKYGCASCNKASKKDPEVKVQLKSATKPPQLIPKSFATSSLLAQIVVQKFCDHLPLYRQEHIFRRLSIDLSRQTMSKWMIKVGDAVIPLINLMQEKILDYDIAYADETTLQVLNEPGRRAQTKSYIWCFIGGPPDQRIIIYQYHASRKGEVANQFFEGFEGAIHSDGYTGYSSLISSENITGINCMAHARRKFVEALPNGKEKGISGRIVRLLRLLYKIEEALKAAQADAETIKLVRQQKSKPILEELKAYLEEKAPCVPPQSRIGKAISYTLKRWNYLTTYLEDGRYDIDNNFCERAIKPFVMGRKAWLFANSVSGAHASARLFSLIETAKANGLDPVSYMKYLFEKLPYCKVVEDYENLLPWNADSGASNFS